MENFESSEVVKIKVNGEESKRLTNEEALLYQDYATKNEGIEFSEQADEESYAEAETLLNEMREKGIELEGMDLTEINLKDIAQQDLLGEKLEKEVAQLAVQNEDKGVMEKIGEVMGSKGIKKIALLLSLFTALSAGTAEAASKKGVEHHAKQEKVKDPVLFYFDGVRATFEFGANGKLDRCQFRSTKHYTAEEYREMDIASNGMIADDYMKVAEDKILKRGGTMNGIQAKLKDVRRNYMVASKLYHDLLHKNENEKALLLKKTMQDGLDRIESSFGVKIFDRAEAERIFNAGK